MTDVDQTLNVVACRADLAPGEMRRVEIAGLEPIAVYNVDGDYFVTADRCTHATASLSDGTLDGECVTCPVHNGTFHIPTGAATHFPAKVDLATFDTTVVDGNVTIRIDTNKPAPSPTTPTEPPAATNRPIETSTPVNVARTAAIQQTVRGSDLIDSDRGRVDRRIFWDQDIYDHELTQIFARSWLFVAHDTQIPYPGDFITTWMGEDALIVVRQADDTIRAFINSCTHRGNRICHADAGHVDQFVCNYHGWSFGIDGGRLLGVHESNIYEADPNWRPDELGLVEVAHLGTYKGLVFATFDRNAPTLAEFLGDFAWYLDVMLDNADGGTEFLAGNVRSVLNCNWKIAAENFVGDSLHAGWTHDSGAQAILDAPVGTLADVESYHANVNGHGWEFNLDGVGNAATLGQRDVMRYLRSRHDEVVERLGETRANMVGAISSVNVFPNFSFLPGQATFRVWHPRGPHQTLLYTWVLVNKTAPQHVKDAYRKGVMMTFSPSGVFEMDDGENWEQATQVNRGVVTRAQPLHYGLGADTSIQHSELPGNVHRGQVNDANQRAFYRHWAQLMDSDPPSIPGTPE